MEKRVFSITAPGVNLVSYEGATDNTSVLTNEVTGWDTDDIINIETKPKAFGEGSYIVSETIGERRLSVTIFIGEEVAQTHSADAWIRFNILSPIRQAALSHEWFNLTRIYKDNTGTPVFQESIQGKVSKVPATAMFADGAWQFTLEFLCPNPRIVFTAA